MMTMRMTTPQVMIAMMIEVDFGVAFWLVFTGCVHCRTTALIKGSNLRAISCACLIHAEAIRPEFRDERGI